MFLLLSNCAFSDMDINPSTTILKQLIKGKTKNK